MLATYRGMDDNTNPYMEALHVIYVCQLLTVPWTDNTKPYMEACNLYVGYLLWHG